MGNWGYFTLLIEVISPLLQLLGSRDPPCTKHLDRITATSYLFLKLWKIPVIWLVQNPNQPRFRLLLGYLNLPGRTVFFSGKLPTVSRNGWVVTFKPTQKTSGLQLETFSCTLPKTPWLTYPFDLDDCNGFCSPNGELAGHFFNGRKIEQTSILKKSKPQVCHGHPRYFQVQHDEINKFHLYRWWSFCHQKPFQIMIFSYSAQGPWNKSFNFSVPIKYVIPQSLKVGHWAEWDFQFYNWFQVLNRK